MSKQIRYLIVKGGVRNLNVATNYDAVSETFYLKISILLDYEIVTLRFLTPAVSESTKAFHKSQNAAL